MLLSPVVGFVTPVPLLGWGMGVLLLAFAVEGLLIWLAWGRWWRYLVPIQLVLMVAGFAGCVVYLRGYTDFGTS